MFAITDCDCRKLQIPDHKIQPTKKKRRKASQQNVKENESKKNFENATDKEIAFENTWRKKKRLFLPEERWKIRWESEWKNVERCEVSNKTSDDDVLLEFFLLPKI